MRVGDQSIRVGRRYIRPSLLVWYAVLGAPVAWALQHLVGFALSQVACLVGGLHGLSLDAWTTAVTVVCLVVAAGGGLAAIVVFRATRGAGSEPPGGRVHFMATIGIAITPLFMAMMVFSGVGVVVLARCHQS